MRAVPMPDYTPPLGVPAARKIVCVSDWTQPHGVAHNKVCVCACQWCKREREMLGAGPEQAELFALDTPPERA